ncbi:hypothetical protein ACRAWD_03190 [Caulobacter segnis]
MLSNRTYRRDLQRPAARRLRQSGRQPGPGGGPDASRSIPTRRSPPSDWAIADSQAAARPDAGAGRAGGRRVRVRRRVPAQASSAAARLGRVIVR